MLRKGGNQLRIGRENPQKHSRTSWVQTSGVDLHNIPQIEWVCPPQFSVDPNWKMESGSESREMHIQIQRESRIAEAIYLRYSDIPANPSVAPDAHDFNGDDSTVPCIPVDMITEETPPDDGDSIPLTPLSPTVEVEETATHPRTLPAIGPPPTLPAMGLPSTLPAIGPTPTLTTIGPTPTLTTIGPPPTLPAIGPPVDEKPEVRSQPLLPRDEVVGTAVALVALIKSKEPGSNIDLELLIQLLRNPGMLEKLLKEHGLSQSSIFTTTPARSTRSEPEPVSIGDTPKMVPEKLATGPIGTDHSWTPSVPFAHSISQDVKDIIDQIRRGSQSQSDRSVPMPMPMTTPMSPMASLPSSSGFDPGKVRKLIDVYGHPTGVQNVSSPSAARTGSIVMKDESYYRRLILQHGTMQENRSPQELRPCVYFNGPRGCRHGSNCRFPHVTVNRGEEPDAKRLKFSGGSFGMRR